MSVPRPTRARLTPSAYFICTTPRSGSTMLIDLLTQTGVSGRPEAYFRQLSVGDFCKAFGIPPQDGWAYDERYIARAISEAKGGGDIAGFRANWEAIDTLQDRLSLYHPNATSDIERLTSALGQTRFIYLERKDKAAQAISRTRAEQSGLWHRNADGSVREKLGKPLEPTYDPTAIKRYLAETEANIAAWQNWFRKNGVSPHEIYYEDIASDPTRAVSGILRFLDLDPAAADAITPGTAKLADDLSTTWAAQFSAEP